MVKPEVIRRRIARFNEYLATLEGCRRYDLATFIGNPEHYGLVHEYAELDRSIVYEVTCRPLGDLQAPEPVFAGVH